MRICQLQNILCGLFVAIFLISCSTSKIEEKREAPVINAGWFKVPFRFAHRDQDDNFLTHPFFDIDQGFVKELKLINFFITTPENNLYKYDLDLYSGKLYKERKYCEVEDIWNQYSGTLFKPNFTMGIVPKTYDQNGNPQKIIVFSKTQEAGKFQYLPTHYYTAKIVGSVVLDACEDYPCDSQSKWKPAQILVAVNAQDSHLFEIDLLSELKTKIDWNYVRAMLANQEGVHQLGQKYFPAFRLSKELSLAETLNYFSLHSRPANMEELTHWRKGCFKLYDEVWDQSEMIRKEKKNQQTAFLNYFKEFYSKNSAQFYACQKLVRPANINDDAKRLWFFTFLQAFTILEKNGFYFNCAEHSWLYNPKREDGRFSYDQMKEVEKCRARDFEKSFDSAINGLSLMRNQTNKNFRFVEYDTQHGGSHQKIYAWIADSKKPSQCKTPPAINKENQFDLFPEDVLWQNFGADDDASETIK